MIKMYKELLNFKENLSNLPICEIPKQTSKILIDYESELPKDFKFDFRKCENYSISEITAAINTLMGSITGDEELDNSIIESIVNLFESNKYYIKLNLIPHVVRYFKMLLDDDQLIKVLYRLERLGYEIGFLDLREASDDNKFTFNKSILDTERDMILDIIYNGDLLIYECD